MRVACIDIGSNTTRLLVAERRDGRLVEVVQQRAFTRLGKALDPDGRLGHQKIAELAEVLSLHARLARELGAEPPRAVATAAVRRASNRDAFCAALTEATGIPIEILSEEDEARLAFLGATKTLGHEPAGDVAVVDVGGGSTEVVVGTVAGGVAWSASLRIGSGDLAEAYLRSDPPSAHELDRLAAHAAGAFEGLVVPPCTSAIAVGGSAASLRRVVGALLEHEAIERAVRVLAGRPCEEVARSFELEPERVRLLPAGLLILEAASQAVGMPLQIGNGGLREGIVIELLART